MVTLTKNIKKYNNGRGTGACRGKWGDQMYAKRKVRGSMAKKRQSKGHHDGVFLGTKAS